MRIRDVTVRTAPFSTATWLDERRISTPMSGYPEYAERRGSWRGPGSDLVWVHIVTDDPEVYGIGQSRGGAVTSALIEHHFRSLLIDRDPLAVRVRSEQLRRAALPYAAGGTLAMGLSAVELALWDLTARSARLPLVTLLGGEPGPLPYYLTCPDPAAIGDLDPDLVAGAATVKVPMPFGPADGRSGLLGNLDLLDRVRSQIPSETGISVDCFMSWTVAYTAAFAGRATGFALDWIEEPLLPDDVDGYARLRNLLAPVRIAGGEHLHSLRDARRFIAAGSADVIQPDVTWCGGIGVASTIGALATDSGLTFAPHAAAAQPWALHLLGACGPGRLAEVLVGLGGVDQVPVATDSIGVGIAPETAGFG